MLEPDRSPIPSRILAARLALYAVGVGSVGFIVGYLAGGSASPVVSELLPLVFALVGGASGIAVAKADLTNLHDTARLAALGLALTVFSGALWVGATWAGSLRLGKSFADLVVHGEHAPASAIRPQSGTEAIVVALLKERLRLLRVEPQLIEDIAEHALGELRERERGLTDKQLEPLINAIAEATGFMPSPKGSEIEGIQTALHWEGTLLRSVSNTAYNSRHAQYLYLTELKKSVWGWLNSPDVGALPAEVRDSLIAIHNHATSLESWLVAPLWVSKNTLTDQVDEFLSAQGKLDMKADSDTPIFVKDPDSRQPQL